MTWTPARPRRAALILLILAVTCSAGCSALDHAVSSAATSAFATPTPDPEHVKATLCEADTRLQWNWGDHTCFAKPPRIAILAASCKQSGTFVNCTGSVKNISEASIRNVDVVVSWLDSAGVTQKADDSLIDFNPILPGQVSPWSTIGTYNPALTKFLIAVKDFIGGTIPSRDDRQR